MRTGFIVFGSIFLVLGLVLFLVPTLVLETDASTTGGTDTDTRTYSAALDIHVGWAYATGIIGAILLTLGLTLPNPVTVRGPRGPRGRVSKRTPKKPKRRKKKALPKGTTVTKTTKTSRKK